MTTVEPTAEPMRARSIGQRLALAMPLLVIALAAVLWWISDRLLYIGPIDRATFGWLVVVPLWAIAPFAGGVAWRGMTARGRTIAAALCALVVGVPLAALLWQSAAFADCTFGSSRTPIEWLVPSITLGTVVGLGFGVATLAAAGEVLRGHRWRALILGAVGQLAIIFAGSVLVFTLFFGICQRPH